MSVSESKIKGPRRSLTVAQWRLSSVFFAAYSGLECDE